MTKDEMYKYLSDLNDKLRKKEIRGHLYLYGGAVLCMALNARTSTHDLDGVFEPKTEIYEAAREVAEDNGLPQDWLNDGVKGFLSSRNEMKPYLSMSNLEISIPTNPYLFAMKCMACRLDEDSNDLNDLRFLIDAIPIDTKEEAEEILLRYFPQRMINSRIGFVLEELFNEKRVR